MSDPFLNDKKFIDNYFDDIKSLVGAFVKMDSLYNLTERNELQEFEEDTERAKLIIDNLYKAYANSKLSGLELDDNTRYIRNS